jgi:hypothetical protein
MLTQAFTLMVDQLTSLDGHLFDSEEQGMMRGLMAVPASQQSLLLRLLQRKPRWFLLKEIEYREVSHPIHAMCPTCLPESSSSVALLLNI